MFFSDYYKKISSYTGEIHLVFEFKNSGEGLVYYTNNAGKLTKYLDSQFIVRDRDALSQNPVWNRFKKEFNEKIIVGYKGLWFVCYPSVWSPSIDAIFLIDTIIAQEHELLRESKSILDFGCGSGRDSKYFLEKGYTVRAIDGSEKLCELASKYIDL